MRRPGLEQRRVNVDFPLWMIESLDREARRLRVARLSIIKVWIAKRHGAVRIATLSRHHLAVVRPGHANSLELLP